ncbi:MAG: DUF4386 domain-containing protein [Spirochaetes bacterium]|nr:DUF4386 domain-containing protein [Spirochaetota bacterium]MBU0956307.1 DUF4386 domain-containing protein [Spirochaetota bacterium]
MSFAAIVLPNGEKIVNSYVGDQPNGAPDTKIARFAGVLWILMSISGAFSQIFVRGSLIVPGNISATANNIRSAELLFRFGFVCDLTMMLLLPATAMVLYKLLYAANRNRAALMVLLAALGAALGMLNCLNELLALRLLGGSEYLNAFSPDQLQAQAMLYLQTYEDGYAIAEVFFMLWVLPLGMLVYKSGFLPRIFGVLFFCETAFGLAGSFTHFLFPSAGIHDLLLIPGACAEISFMLWLAIKGIKKNKQSH